MAGVATKAKEIWYKGELHRTRKGSTKMQDYLAKMKSIANNLQMAGSYVSLIDLFAQILSGLDSDYTPIVTQLTFMSNLSWIEFSTALLTFESKIEQLSAFQNLNIDGSVSVNNVQSQKYNSNNSRGRGSPRGKGRGRGRQFNSKPICQICGKTSHLASIYYYRTDFSYMGNALGGTKPANTQNNYTAYVATPEVVTDEAWCLDTGASHHVTNNAEQLQQKSKYNGKTKLAVADGKCLPIHHIGSTFIHSSNQKPLLLKNVIHTPCISRNLISVAQLTAQNNLCIEFDSTSFTVKEKISKKELLHGKSKNGLYLLCNKVSATSQFHQQN